MIDFLRVLSFLVVASTIHLAGVLSVNRVSSISSDHSDAGSTNTAAAPTTV